MKSMLLVIILVATVDCRSHFKPPSEPLENTTPEWIDFPDGSQSPYGSNKKGSEMHSPSHVADGELYQSDIILTEDQWSALRERSAIADETKRWPEGPDGYPQVPYIFIDSDNPTAVIAGLDHWMKHTCIKFWETRHTDQPHLKFSVKYNKKGRKICKSRIGMVPDPGPDSGQGIWACSRSVVHEVGHAMGFWHEQSRSDRDSYVTIKWDNIKKNMKRQFDNHFGDNNFSVPYDYTSVMHYSKNAWNIDESKPTIVTKDILNIDLIGRRGELSHRDKLLANRMYNCTGKWLVECGQSSDPCLNDGYTGKYCSCVCPPGTSGTNCENKVGDYYGSPWCGGLFNSNSGTIRHLKNRKNEHCIWNINTAKPIKITFSRFNTFKNHDHLYIRDGENVTSPLAGIFTGNILPNPVHISTNKAYIVFQSNPLYTVSGFELQWEPAGCDGVCTSSSGTIRYPSSGSNYENNDFHNWEIKTESAICITFISFDIEDGYDYLYVLDGESKEIRKFTGSSVPSPFQTTNNVTDLFFSSNPSVTKTGFEIQWKTSAC